METFNTILDSLLKSYEQNPEADIVQLLEEKAKELGLSADGLKKLKEVFGMLDAFEEKASSLQEARRQGQDRDTWMIGEMAQIAKRGNVDAESQEKVVNAMAECVEKAIETENTTKEG